MENQKNLLVNWEFIKKCSLAVKKTTDERIALSGVAIIDRNENGRFYRYYIGCDGAILLGYKVRIEKIETNETILKLDNFKLTKDEEKRIADNQNLLLLEKNIKHDFYDTTFGRIYIVNAYYPSFWQLFGKKYRSVEIMHYISYKNHTILEKFWKTNDKFTKYAERCFFVNADTKNEEKSPLFNFRKLKDNVLQFSMVMGLVGYLDFDLKELKKFDF